MSTKRKPSKIKIGWREYKIIFSKEVVSEGDGLFGQLVYNENLIRMRPDIDINEQKITLIHEICHAIFYFMGSQLKKDEDFIKGLSEHLYQVVKDNPDFFRWLING